MEKAADVSGLAAPAQELRSQGASVMHPSERALLLACSPWCRPRWGATTAQALARLRAGVRIVMATGDGLATAQSTRPWGSTKG